ncbi:MAG: arylsulfatase A-like enzyme [Kiritimatiellia bacterium]|jgi:arylsulfatase A-like enzyme
MYRRSFLLIAACMLSLSTTMLHAAKLAGSRPNIILIMTDDQGMGDLSCMGNPILKTPHTDALYAKSTRFTDFHVSPTCAPTRSAMMSGRHDFRNGVTHTIFERERMALSTHTIAQALASTGYETGIFGKWHLGDEEAYQPYRRGFSETFIHGAGGIGQSYKGSCADFPPNRQNTYFDTHVLHNDTVVKTKGFCTDVFFQQALGWIQAQDKADKPFFAYISLNAPHGPMIAPKKYTQPWLDAGWDNGTAGRYGMIVNIDDNIGTLMQKLDAWDLWKDTLVIFMTDNGAATTRGKKNGKQTKLFDAGLKNLKGSVNEGGTHVPAFWRWQGVLGEGVDIKALTAHIDLYKTFVDLSGAELPKTVQKIDGRSLLPLLEDPKAAWADRHLVFHCGRWAPGKDPNEHKYKTFAVRSQRWRLIGKDTLYDIINDPSETTDVSEAHPDVVKDMMTFYDAWWTETMPFLVNENVPNPTEKPQWARYEEQKKTRGIPDWVAPAL